jgi:hypothetical protein
MNEEEYQQYLRDEQAEASAMMFSYRQEPHQATLARALKYVCRKNKLVRGRCVCPNKATEDAIDIIHGAIDACHKEREERAKREYEYLKANRSLWSHIKSQFTGTWDWGKDRDAFRARTA